MILQESIVKKAVEFAKNNKGKLLAGPAAPGGAAYYAHEHPDAIKNLFDGKTPAASGAKSEKPEKPENPAASGAKSEKPEKPENPAASGAKSEKPEKPETPAASGTKSEKPEKPETPAASGTKSVPKYNAANSKTSKLQGEINQAVKQGNSKKALESSKEYMEKVKGNEHHHQVEPAAANQPQSSNSQEPDTTGIPDIEPKYEFNSKVPMYKANWRNLRTQDN